ncbi:hypothetical protein ACLOJK_000156 [Asimina triloba]
MTLAWAIVAGTSVAGDRTLPAFGVAADGSSLGVDAGRGERIVDCWPEKTLDGVMGFRLELPFVAGLDGGLGRCWSVEDGCSTLRRMEQMVAVGGGFGSHGCRTKMEMGF